MGATVSADEAANTLIELELMLKQWAQDGPFLYTKRESSQTLVASTANYTLSSSLPIRLIEVRYRDTSSPVSDIPMQPLTREQYFELPNKTATGTPTTYYFDPVPTGGVLYIW